MYQVDYSGQMSYISSYFCCHVRVEGLLHDTECDLLAIAKFRVPLSLRYFTKYNHCFFSRDWQHPGSGDEFGTRIVSCKSGEISCKVCT